MATQSPGPQSGTAGGLPYALGAYVSWGLLPLYLLLVRQVPAFEFVGWRILLTVPVCLVIVAARRQFGQLRLAFATPRVLGLLLVSSVLIAINWFTYIWAIMAGQVYGASLGYYINPLVNVVLATVFLGERLGRMQWAAVAVALAGIAPLVVEALDTLWIMLTLAFSFGGYGLVRKLAPVGALPGLTVEAILLSPLSAGIVWWYASGPQGSGFGAGTVQDLAILASGIVTGVPLLLFATAARRMSYSTLGFVQFIAPTMVFIIGLTVFDQPLVGAQLLCFCLIWLAIALFVWDLVMRGRRPAQAVEGEI